VGGDVVENSAVKVVGFSGRNCWDILCINCALCAAGMADLGHFWKAEATVVARLHDDINRIVAWLGRRPGFKFGEKSLDSIPNLLLKGMKRWGKSILCSRITTEATVIREPAVG